MINSHEKIAVGLAATQRITKITYPAFGPGKLLVSMTTLWFCTDGWTDGWKARWVALM